MSNPALRALVDAFVAKLEIEIRNAALAAVTASLRGASPAAPRPSAKKAKPAAKKAAPARAGAAPAEKKAVAKPAKRARRSPADLDRDVGRLVAFVRANNCATNEKVRAALHLSKTEWTSTLAKAVATKQLTTRGEKRNTTLHLLGSK